MAKTDWHYSWLRDLTALMYFFVGALTFVVAAMWIPLVWNMAATAFEVGQELVFVGLCVLPVCFMLVWTLAWWFVAVRRALRMRELVRSGVSVLANVEKMKVHRYYEGGITGVDLWLQYELDGKRFNIKKKTAWRRVIPSARDLGRVELAVDPNSPESVAFVVDGRLG